MSEKKKFFSSEITDELEGKAGSAEKTKDSFEEKMVSKSARSSSECGDYEEVSKCAKESCECTGFGRFSMCGGETSEAAGDLYQAQTLDATQAVFAVKTLRNYFLKWLLYLMYVVCALRK